MRQEKRLAAPAFCALHVWALVRPLLLAPLADLETSENFRFGFWRDLAPATQDIGDVGLGVTNGLSKLAKAKSAFFQNFHIVRHFNHSRFLPVDKVKHNQCACVYVDMIIICQLTH